MKPSRTEISSDWVVTIILLLILAAMIALSFWASNNRNSQTVVISSGAPSTSGTPIGKGPLAQAGGTQAQDKGGIPPFLLVGGAVVAVGAGGVLLSRLRGHSSIFQALKVGFKRKPAAEAAPAPEKEKYRSSAPDTLVEHFKGEGGHNGQIYLAPPGSAVARRLAREGIDIKPVKRGRLPVWLTPAYWQARLKSKGKSTK